MSRSERPTSGFRAILITRSLVPTGTVLLQDKRQTPALAGAVGYGQVLNSLGRTRVKYIEEHL